MEHLSQDLISLNVQESIKDEGTNDNAPTPAFALTELKVEV